MNKKMIRRIICVMEDYFDVDNVTMSSTDDTSTGVSATMFSNEDPYRSAHLNMVKDGPIKISVDYSIPDSTMKIRLWDIEFIGSVVSRFCPLTMDITYPDELVCGIKEILKNNFTGEN